MKLKIPPPIYMLLHALLAYGLAQYPVFSLQLPLWIILFPAIPAIGLLLNALIGFIQHKTTVNPHSPEKATSLVTSGVYRYSRNPMYLGFLLLLVSWVLYLGSLSSLTVLPLFVLVLNTMQIIPEETCLKQRFSESYAAYTHKVRRWI